MPDKPTLKQFGDLTQTDFKEHPVWVACHGLDDEQPWYDDTDEETFRPWDGELPYSPSEGMGLLRATLKLADGREFPGFITPQFENEPLDLGLMQPQIFLPSGTLVGFWDGMFKHEEAKERVYAELGQDSKAIFPIAFAADQGLSEGCVSGIIPGFCWKPTNEVLVYV